MFFFLRGTLHVVSVRADAWWWSYFDGGGVDCSRWVWLLPRYLG